MTGETWEESQSTRSWFSLSLPQVWSQSGELLPWVITDTEELFIMSDCFLSPEKFFTKMLLTEANIRRKYHKIYAFIITCKMNYYTSTDNKENHRQKRCDDKIASIYVNEITIIIKTKKLILTTNYTNILYLRERLPRWLCWWLWQGSYIAWQNVKQNRNQNKMHLTVNRSKSPFTQHHFKKKMNLTTITHAMSISKTTTHLVHNLKKAA
jgi:hypothetical protein